MYWKNSQLISISGFYKNFINPIEIVQFATQRGAFQPRNVGNGQLIGAEFELRQNLDFISKKLNTVTFNVNYTYTYSRIELSKTEFDSRTENARTGQIISNFRDMAGQAPYIVNAGLFYKGKNGFWENFEAGLYYNVQGKTLMYAGIADRPDIYSNPFHSLNYNTSLSMGSQKRLQLSFKVDNILNSKQESVFVAYMAEDQFFSRLSVGRSYKLKISYAL